MHEDRSGVQCLNEVVEFGKIGVLEMFWSLFTP
jgi:hypothetical protein